MNASVFAVDLGGHTITAARIDREEILALAEAPTPPSRSFEDVTDRISTMLRDMDAPEAPLGIGVPGFLDAPRETLKSAPNFPSWRNLPLRRRWENALARPVRVENDANCYALGEGYAGEARGMKDYIVFTLGTGIGGGLVSGGRLITGHYGMGGEIGHIWTNHLRLCGGGCGGRGHLEALAGADGLSALAKEEGLPSDVKKLWEQRSENPRIEALWDQALTHLAGAVASLMHVLDPEAVIFGGGISRAPGLLDILEEKTLPLLALPFRDTLNLKKSMLQSKAPLFGAASLWAEKTSSP